MSDKAKFLAKIHEKCPYCERPFVKSKHVVNSKIVHKWAKELFNAENS